MKSLSKKSCKRGGQRGSAVILFTFVSMLVVIPLVGLAIDGAIVMWEKARLSASVDAAALAAGRSLSVGQNLASQTANATATAINYFNANFAPGQMHTTVVNGQPTVAVAQTSNSTRTVTIDATALVPLYFLRVLGFSNSTISAHGQASRRDVNVMLVLDRSGSMAQSNSCNPMIASAQTFVNMFIDGRDQLGLITFSTTANPNDYPPTTTFKSSNPSLSSVLGNLVCSGATNSAEALSEAHAWIVKQGMVGALNIVVFFSDGYPTALTFGTNNPPFTQAGSPQLPIITATGIAAGQTDARWGWFYPGWQYQNGQPVPDYNHLYATAASSCTSSNSVAGVLVAVGTQNPDPNGLTEGVLDPTPVSISSNATSNPITDAGCNFTDSNDYGGYSPLLARNDIAYIPATDAYGNPTAAYLASTPQSNPAHPADLFSYGGTTQIRPDTPKGIVNAAFVAADNAAYSIRNDSTYNTVIYTIGLGSLVDTELMQRIANDPQSTSFDKSRNPGFYIYAPSSNQLQTAFQQVASQILRISQ